MVGGHPSPVRYAWKSRYALKMREGEKINFARSEQRLSAHLQRTRVIVFGT